MEKTGARIFIFRELVDHESVLLLSSIEATTNWISNFYFEIHRHISMISQRLLTPLKPIIRGLFEFVSLVSYVVVTKRLPIIFHALEFSCEKKKWMTEQKKKTPPGRDWYAPAGKQTRRESQF